MDREKDFDELLKTCKTDKISGQENIDFEDELETTTIQTKRKWFNKSDDIDSSSESDKVQEKKTCQLYPEATTPVLTLNKIFHSPVYSLPIPTNEKFKHLTLEARSRMLFDYFTRIHNLQMKQYRKSTIKAPQPKDIHPTASGSPVKQSDLEEPKSVYVSRAGRQIKRKDYSEDASEGDDELKLELVMKKYKIDDTDTKLTFEDIPSALPDVKTTPKRSPAPKTISRTNKILQNARIEEEKSRVTSQEMEDFERCLTSGDDFPALDENKDDEDFEKIRVSPPLLRKTRRGPINKNKKPMFTRNQSRATSTSPSTSQPKNSQKEKVSCPICASSFNADEIQDHASNCGLDIEPVKEKLSLQCEICNAKFILSTKYELHVKECIASKVTNF